MSFWLTFSLRPSGGNSEKKKGLTFSLAQQLTAAALFAPMLDKTGAIDIVTYSIRRNEVAARSPKKKTRIALQTLGFALDTG